MGALTSKGWFTRGSTSLRSGGNGEHFGRALSEEQQHAFYIRRSRPKPNMFSESASGPLMHSAMYLRVSKGFRLSECAALCLNGSHNGRRRRPISECFPGNSLRGDSFGGPWGLGCVWDGRLSIENQAIHPGSTIGMSGQPSQLRCRGGLVQP